MLDLGVGFDADPDLDFGLGLDLIGRVWKRRPKLPLLCSRARKSLHHGGQF